MEIATPPDFSPNSQSQIADLHKILSIFLADICRSGGADYVGIQRAFSPTAPVLVLFQSPRGSCLAVPLIGITPLHVAARIRQAELAFRPKTPVRNRFRLAKRIHQMIARDVHDWDLMIDNFRRLRSARAGRNIFGTAQNLVQK
jgi:hypothetical protein